MSTAGWVISVRRSCSSASAIASESSRSAKTIPLSSLPSSSGRITSSASAKTSATSGSIPRSSASMFAYCEPWPV